MGLIAELSATERAQYWERELEETLANTFVEMDTDGAADPRKKLQLASIALHAGQAEVELAAEVGLAELQRKVVHLREAQKLKDEGMSETKSLEQARASNAYVVFCQDLVATRAAQQTAELVRKVALVVAGSA